MSGKSYIVGAELMSEAEKEPVYLRYSQTQARWIEVDASKVEARESVNAQGQCTGFMDYYYYYSFRDGRGHTHTRNRVPVRKEYRYMRYAQSPDAKTR